MTFFQQLSLGWGTYSEAHRFIMQHRLYRLFLIPVLINILLFTLLMWLGISWASGMAESLYAWLALDAADWGNWNWAKDVIYWSLSIILHLLVIVVYLSTVRYIMLILIAPVLAYVSEKTEEIATGKAYPFSLGQLLKDAWRGAKLAFRNGIAELLITILLFAFGFIPVLGWFAPFILFGVQSYFYGFSMLDYYFERQRLDADSSRRYIYGHKWVAVGNGAYFNGLIYLLTFLVAALPFVLALLAKTLFVVPVLFLSVLPIYSAVASTLAALKLDKNNLPHGQAR